MNNVLELLLAVFFVRRVNGHGVCAELLVKTVGPQIVKISDAKGRWVAKLQFVGIVNFDFRCIFKPGIRLQ